MRSAQTGFERKGTMRYRMEPQELAPWPPPARSIEGYCNVTPHIADEESCRASECVCGEPLMAVALRRNGSYRVWAVCLNCCLAVEL